MSVHESKPANEPTPKATKPQACSIEELMATLDTPIQCTIDGDECEVVIGKETKAIIRRESAKSLGWRKLGGCTKCNETLFASEGKSAPCHNCDGTAFRQWYHRLPVN